MISGFSCVNTRLAVDTDILMLNVKPDLAAGEFQERKRQDLKIVYSLKLSDDEKHKNYRLLSKILNMHENNQYGQVMTKLLPTGCIKKEKTIFDWHKFNLTIKKIAPEDLIGQIFVVNIEFDCKNAAKIISFQCNTLNF